jgi:hypothetical protein
MIGSSLSLFSFASAGRPAPSRDIAAQRRALVLELVGSAGLAGLAVAAASVALPAGTQLLAAAPAIAAGLCRYVEIMFRIAYLNRLPLRDAGLLDLADRARRLCIVCAGVLFAAAAILLVQG